LRTEQSIIPIRLMQITRDSHLSNIFLMEPEHFKNLPFKLLYHELELLGSKLLLN